MLSRLTADNASQQVRLDQSGELLLQRRVLIERLLRLRADGVSPSDPAVQQLVLEGFEVGRSLNDLGAEIERHEHGLLAERTTAAAHTERRTTATLLYGSSASLLVMLAIVVWLLSSTRGPLRSLVAGAGQLARGDYGHRVAHVSKDEIGDLATAFSKKWRSPQDRSRMSPRRLEDVA